MYDMQREFELSLQRSLIRRARRRQDEQQNMFGQHPAVWLVAFAGAIAVVVFLLALRAVV